MSWSVIAAEGTNPRLSAAAASALRSMGAHVPFIFHIDRTVIRLQCEPDSGPSTIEFQIGSEGLGYHLNRCMEISEELDGAIQGFLVVGGDYNPVLSRQEIVEAVEIAIQTQQLVLGFAVDHLQPSTDELLDFLNKYRHSLISAGAGGIMVGSKELWRSVSGFREDMGGWGTEIHFALDCLTAGHKMATMPWSAGPIRVVGQKYNHLVATLVAFGTYGRDQSVLTKIRGLRSSLSVGLLAPGQFARKVYQAREILRTRRFLESGR